MTKQIKNAQTATLANNVYTTTDFSKFKRISCNRDIKEENVNYLVSRMRQHINPFVIVVDKNLRIIDGNHRFEAISRLNNEIEKENSNSKIKKALIPINYQIDEKATDADIIRLNEKNTSWKKEDYLKYYIEKGNIHYITLRDFKTRHNLPLRICELCLTFTKNSGTGSTKDGLVMSTSQMFKSGKFETKGTIQQSNKIAINFKSLEELVPFYMNVNFVYALYTCMQHPNFDWDTFYRKVSMNRKGLYPCSRTTQYIDVIREVYNKNTTAAKRI